MTLDAGHAQITVGLAWWYRKYASEQSAQDVAAYEFSEQEAKAKRIGLWREDDPVPPWEWRTAQREKQVIRLLPARSGRPVASPTTGISFRSRMPAP